MIYNLVQNLKPTTMTANIVNPIKTPTIMGPLFSGFTVFGGGQCAGLDIFLLLGVC